MPERDPREAARSVLLSLAETGVPVHPRQARRLWRMAGAEGDEEFEARLREARERREARQAATDARMAEERGMLDALVRRARGEGIDLEADTD